MGKIAVAGDFGVALGEVVVKDGQQLAVRVEHAVHVPHVPGPQRRRQYFGAAVITVAPARQPRVVSDIPGRLFHVRHQPAAFEHLCEQVGRLLASQVDPTELGHRIVAVLEENTVVELLRPGQADRGVDAVVPAYFEVAHELVEEQAAQALGGAGIAGEQRALYDLRQVDERKYRSVEVREVPAEDVGLRGHPVRVADAQASWSVPPVGSTKAMAKPS